MRRAHAAPPPPQQQHWELLPMVLVQLSARGMPCTQYKVLYAGKYSNPSFGPLGEHPTRYARGVEIWPSGPPKHTAVPTLGAHRLGILGLIRDTLE